VTAHCGAPVPSPMRHLEARGFQDFAKIAKEFPGRVVGTAGFGRCADDDNSGLHKSRFAKIQVLRDHSQDRWE